MCVSPHSLWAVPGEWGNVTGLLVQACSCKMGIPRMGDFGSKTFHKRWIMLKIVGQSETVYPASLRSHPSRFPSPLSAPSLFPLIGIFLDKFHAHLILSWHLLLEETLHYAYNCHIFSLAKVRFPKCTYTGTIPIKPKREEERIEKGTPRCCILYFKPAN